MASIRAMIARDRTRKLPTAKNKNKYSPTWIDRLLNQKNQVRLLFSAIFITFVLKVSQLQAIDVASEHVWLRIGVLIITGVVVFLRLKRIQRAIKDKRVFSYLIATVLFTVVVVLWSTDQIRPVINSLTPYQYVAKLFIGWITILWFPTQFLNAFRNHRITNYILYGMFWAGLAAIWGYGLLTGFIVAFLLLIWPAYRLLSATKEEQRELPQRLGKRFYIPSLLSLLIVAIFVTHEPFWLLGIAIWLMFIWATRLSFEHFRKTYDLIEELFPDTKGRDQKNRFLLISLVLSILLLTPGILGKLEANFVIDLYLQAAGLAFALITILLAVQAIIPGVTTWSGEENLSRRLREMRSILRANAGLNGFMQLFFLLFIFSLLGWLITSRFFSAMTPLIDLSIEYHLSPRIFPFKTLWQATQLGFPLDSIWVAFSTLYFAAFVSLAIYAIAQLY